MSTCALGLGGERSLEATRAHYHLRPLRDHPVCPWIPSPLKSHPKLHTHSTEPHRTQSNPGGEVGWAEGVNRGLSGWLCRQLPAALPRSGKHRSAGLDEPAKERDVRGHAAIAVTAQAHSRAQCGPDTSK